MQTTGHFHSHVREAFFKITESILENTTTFDASNNMLHFNPETSDDTIEQDILSG